MGTDNISSMFYLVLLFHSCHYGVVTECRFYQGCGIGTDPLGPMGEATTISPSFFSDNNTLYITQHMHNPHSVDALFTKQKTTVLSLGGTILFSRQHTLATLAMGRGEIVYLGFDI